MLAKRRGARSSKSSSRDSTVPLSLNVKYVVMSDYRACDNDKVVASK
jgi:hypothetical protein